MQLRIIGTDLPGRDCPSSHNFVPESVLAKAAKSGVLVGRLALTDVKGQPLCAAVRPPMIEWSVG
jgi:hypothetical protein